jgi:hypothetical protein
MQKGGRAKNKSNYNSSLIFFFLNIDRVMILKTQMLRLGTLNVEKTGLPENLWPFFVHGLVCIPNSRQVVQKLPNQHPI